MLLTQHRKCRSSPTRSEDQNIPRFHGFRQCTQRCTGCKAKLIDKDGVRPTNDGLYGYHGLLIERFPLISYPADDGNWGNICNTGPWNESISWVKRLCGHNLEIQNLKTPKAFWRLKDLHLLQGSVVIKILEDSNTALYQYGLFVVWMLKIHLDWLAGICAISVSLYRSPDDGTSEMR